ncbi:protein of unknown function [Candidatus Promineifilum breve]|uniref:Uncharacterized protein n=1 Tax=Candidatus Promineifilum breve TaxID=1806508 RepID=A0A160T8R2_9CHLR|nr:protein of unknown function [Candidatus Promineifilum breve]
MKSQQKYELGIRNYELRMKNALLIPNS